MPKLTGFPSIPIPGPRPLPIPRVGHLPRVFRFLADPIAAVTELRPLGDVVAVCGGSPALVCAFGAERHREVLGNPDGYRHDEGFIGGPPGSSLARITQVLVAINGETHKRHRRLMAPAFSKTALDGYADEIVRVSEAVIDRWPRGAVIDLDAKLRELALCVAVRSLYGLDVINGATELGELAAGLLETLTSPLAILLPYDLPGTPFRRALRQCDRLLARLEALVEEKRRAADPGNDALALLMGAADDDGTGLRGDELLSEAVTLFVAGHETTAKALTWTMFLLERHPTVLADVLEEIDGVLGGRSMTAADIPRLPLLDRVIKESMRVLAPVPILFLRVPASDLPLGRFTLPKGANVVISPYAMHHDPELYPEPQRFRPERWEGLRPTIYEYLPFGAGPRICIGAAFAQQSLRLVLPTLLQRIRIAIPRDTRVDRLTRGNILMLRHGLPARIEAVHRRRLVPEPVRGDVHEMVALQ
jgi:cytochrome P450